MYEQFIRIRKPIEKIVYYLLPVFLLTSVLTYADHENYKLWGSLSLWLVIYLIFLKPISVIWPNRYLLFLRSMRRPIGIAAFWLAMFHGGSMIYENKFFELSQFQGFLFWGLCAAIGMLILGITSNNYATKLLKKNWKRLHRIAYPTLFLILWHSGLARGDLRLFYTILVLFLLLKLGQWQKDRLRKKKAQREEQNETQ